MVRKKPGKWFEDENIQRITVKGKKGTEYYIYIYIYVCVCVCVCTCMYMCECERERERECVCVGVCIQDLALNNLQGLICH